MEKGGESIQPKLEREKSLKVCQVKNFDELEKIRMIGDSEEVQMGDCLLLKKNEDITAYSYGAGPCISGVLQTEDNKFYMFHSVASILTQEQIEIIRNTKKGIVGGGIESLDNFSSEFKNKNIKIIQSLGKNYDFNIVFVKAENQFKVSPGIYYCYDQLNINQ